MSTDYGRWRKEVQSVAPHPLPLPTLFNHPLTAAWRVIPWGIIAGANQRCRISWSGVIVERNPSSVAVSGGRVTVERNRSSVVIVTGDLGRCGTRRKHQGGCSENESFTHH